MIELQLLCSHLKIFFFVSKDSVILSFRHWECSSMQFVWWLPRTPRNGLVFLVVVSTSFLHISLLHDMVGNVMPERR